MDHVNNARIKAYKLLISHVKWLKLKKLRDFSELFLVSDDIGALWHEDCNSACYDL